MCHNQKVRYKGKESKSYKKILKVDPYLKSFLEYCKLLTFPSGLVVTPSRWNSEKEKIVEAAQKGTRRERQNENTTHVSIPPVRLRRGKGQSKGPFVDGSQQGQEGTPEAGGGVAPGNVQLFQGHSCPTPGY